MPLRREPRKPPDLPTNCGIDASLAWRWKWRLEKPAATEFRNESVAAGFVSGGWSGWCEGLE